MVIYNKHGIRVDNKENKKKVNSNSNAKDNIKGGLYSKSRTNTTTQFRKHYTQMTEEDKVRIVNMLCGIKKLVEHSHVKNKRGVSYNKEDIYINLKDKLVLLGSIVEYNEIFDRRKRRWNQRVLLRFPKTYKVEVKVGGKYTKEDCHLCVVIDLTTKVIVTVYYNQVKDNHDTIRLNKYSKVLEVREFKSGGYLKTNLGLRESIRVKYDNLI